MQSKITLLIVIGIVLAWVSFIPSMCLEDQKFLDAITVHPVQSQLDDNYTNIIIAARNKGKGIKSICIG
jgi:hypothetical protein